MIALVFFVLGGMAASLNSHNKRYICWVYMAGITIEHVALGLFHYFGVFYDYWDFYYGTIGVIDLITLAAMLWVFHSDYFVALLAVSLMAVANVTIVFEWSLLKSTFFFDRSEHLLPMLNGLLLLVLFGMSDGIHRIIDNSRKRLLGRIFKYAHYRIRYKFT